MLESFAVHTFSGRVGEAFRIHPGDHDPLDVELVTATDLSERPGEEPRGRPFSMVFRGPKDVLLPQRIYRVEHALLSPSRVPISWNARDAPGGGLRRSGGDARRRSFASALSRRRGGTRSRGP
ncbi:MAG TPA: hypothetical protein VKA51_10260 [Rubrobacteraceae bacterium]|nr:hypothetical protein [Rubrobacteraceae bacterium]